MDAETWASIYLGETDISKELQSEHVKLTKGDEIELVSIFNMFDKFDSSKNFKVQPIKENK